MSVLKRIKEFFATAEHDSVTSASGNRFSAASDAFDDAYAIGETHTTRANHCYTVNRAAHAVEDAESYNMEIAGYGDPTDFDRYSVADLDAHTAAIENIASAFDRLTAAFVAYSPDNHLYKSAAAVYKASRGLYVFAIESYGRAAHCAMTTALEGNLQTAKDDFEIMLNDIKVTRSAPKDAKEVAARADAYKARATYNATEAKRLEQKATIAQAKADALRADARFTTGNAEEAFEWV